MKYPGKFVEGRFIHRDNRFIARVEIDGKEERVHVPNTGRCKELLIPGTRVYLQESQNKARKTAYSLISLEKGNLLINLDSQAPNKLVREAYEMGKLPFIQEGPLKSEVTYGKSRLDFAYPGGFIEVKGVTLENKGMCAFPDAVTARGTKHVYELIHAIQEGYVGHLIFVLQMEGPQLFSPNYQMDPAFQEAIEEGLSHGLKIHAYDCQVKPDEITLGREVEVKIGEQFYDA